MVHTWYASMHDDCGVQTPPVQVSVALQQGIVAEQLWLVSAHALTAAHVPLVAPGRMSQV